MIGILSNFTFLYGHRRKYFDRNFIKIQHFWRETKANILVKILHYSTETNKYFKGNFVTNEYFEGNFDKFLHFCTDRSIYFKGKFITILHFCMESRDTQQQYFEVNFADT